MVCLSEQRRLVIVSMRLVFQPYGYIWMNSVYTCTRLVFKTYSKSSLGTLASIDYQELSKLLKAQTQMAQENTVIQEIPIIFNAVTYIVLFCFTYKVLLLCYIYIH